MLFKIFAVGGQVVTTDCTDNPDPVSFYNEKKKKTIPVLLADEAFLFFFFFWQWTVAKGNVIEQKNDMHAWVQDGNSIKTVPPGSFGPGGHPVWMASDVPPTLWTITESSYSPGSFR